MTQETNGVATETLSDRLARLAELDAKLAGVDELTKERDELRKELESVPVWELIAASRSASAPKPKESLTPQANEDIRGWLADHVFKGNKKNTPQRIDSKVKENLRKELKAKGTKVDKTQIDAAVLFYCENHKEEKAKGRSAMWTLKA